MLATVSAVSTQSQRNSDARVIDYGNRPQDVSERAALYIDLAHMTDKPEAQRVYMRNYVRTLIGGIGK